MKNKNLIVGGFLVFIVVIAIVFYIYDSRPDTSAPLDSERAAPNVDEDITSPFLGENKEVQLPSLQAVQTVIIRSAVLNKPGFVVIRDDLFGEPAVIVGVSDPLPSGESRDVAIDLSVLQGGSLLYALLHADDGDQYFDQRDDSPVTDEAGELKMVRFALTKDAGKSVDLHF